MAIPLPPLIPAQAGIQFCPRIAGSDRGPRFCAEACTHLDEDSGCWRSRPNPLPPPPLRGRSDFPDFAPANRPWKSGRGVPHRALGAGGCDAGCAACPGPRSGGEPASSASQGASLWLVRSRAQPASATSETNSRRGTPHPVSLGSPAARQEKRPSPARGEGEPVAVSGVGAANTVGKSCASAFAGTSGL